MYENIFILTGAGVSAESGLSTFRDKDGLWARYKIEDVATIAAYERDQQRVLDFYNMRRASHGEVKPNPAHIALAQLEAAWNERGQTVTICTQNIDPLHRLGPSASSICTAKSARCVAMIAAMSRWRTGRSA